ncbi:MAG: multidrug ABC transporter ATP-binding protein [Sulfobacillus benefaciens]|uniref:Multidrug ABC transporter ATP-binding protein n=1 Tax=Sulfobacillus benefaciens TaxID=453960 RepID=A0A2T2XIV4_9FIRM|nr:MAG: multidrug ABC transporter ATP-binding protein [Sulfobacillus benefaciens]
MLPHRGKVALSLAILLAATATDVFQPILIKIFIDQYLIPHHFPENVMVALAVGYMGLVVATSVLNVFQLLLFQMLALDIIQTLRVELFDKIQEMALSFFDQTPVGVLVSRITNDTEAILDMFMTVLSTFIQNITVLAGILIAMFALDARLATYCLVLVPVIAGVMILYRRVSSPVFHQSRQRLALLNAKLNESLQGMPVIQSMRQEPRLKREFGDINESYRRARFRNTQINGLLLRPLMDVIYFFVLMLVLWYFGERSFAHLVNIGVLYAFVTYLSRFFEPVNNMLQRMNFFQQAMVSAERVFQILDNPLLAPKPEGTSDPVIWRGQVKFDNVSFSYDGVTDVLKHISFTAEPGKTVAIVGHTGSGKSSIVNLLMRFYPVEHGRIFLDGADLKTFSDKELRSKIGLVLQDPFLFVGDIASNIRLGNEEITDAQVEAAAQFVQADTFIRRLPEGYHAPIGERGATLSTGQRQLISFARTMATNPTILVLDEATASVDTETEDAIQMALKKMRHGRTTIAIAHRLSTIQDADLILVLHHGEIVERGSHQELLALGGLYHKMYLLQQGGARE